MGTMLLGVLDELRERWATGVGILLFACMVGCIAPDGCITNDCLELGECYGTKGDGLLYPLEEGAWWQVDNVDRQTNQQSCKVVSVGPSKEIPLLDGVTAFEVYSVRDDSWGIRWQEVLDDGTVLRRLDEWFELPPEEEIDQIPNVSTNRTKIKYYCPSRTRVADGDRACECSEWAEDRWEASIKLDDANPESWSVCQEIKIDTENCELIDELPQGCDFSRDQTHHEYEIRVLSPDDVADELEIEKLVVRAGAFDEALMVTRWGEEFDVADPEGSFEEDKDIYYWVRGVGKVRDDSQADKDKLVDWCVPSAPNYPDCAAARPSFISTAGMPCP